MTPAAAAAAVLMRVPGQWGWTSGDSGNDGCSITIIKGLYWKPQIGNPKNIAGIYSIGRYIIIPIIYLLYSWGSLFGVPSRVPLHYLSQALLGAASFPSVPVECQSWPAWLESH